jgi:hypothetical protein
MLTVTIVLCSWCVSARPVRVDGAEKIPPGLHDAKLQISHGMCSTCEVKFMESIGNDRPVSHPDTGKSSTGEGTGQ